MSQTAIISIQQAPEHHVGLTAQESWMSALSTPTEIPSSLLPMSGMQNTTLPISHQKEKLKRWRTHVVIPSVKSCQKTMASPLSANVRMQPRQPGNTYSSGPLSGPTDSQRMSSAMECNSSLAYLAENGNLRIAVLGAAQSGKTALVNRLVEGTFMDQYYPTSETIQRKTISLDCEDYQLEIIDTSGIMQDHETFYSSIAHGILLVFDVSEPESFEHVKVLLDRIRSATAGRRLPIGVVGTHVDTYYGQPDRLSQEYNTQVERWGCDFFTLSSALSPRCVNVFYQLARTIRTQYLSVAHTSHSNECDTNTLNSLSVRSAPAKLSGADHQHDSPLWGRSQSQFIESKRSFRGGLRSICQKLSKSKSCAGRLN